MPWCDLSGQGRHGRRPWPLVFSARKTVGTPRQQVGRDEHRRRRRFVSNVALALGAAS